MDLLIDLLIALLAFGLLLGTGAWAFGAQLGGWARGAAVPLLVVPLLSDALRFLFPLPFTSAFGLAAAAALLGAIICGWRRENGAPTLEFTAHWRLAFLVLLGIHILLRLWIVAERGPNPADDVFAGHKAHGVLFSTTWPTSHPEASELPFSYYYYAYTWPAALAALGVSLKAGWWLTALVLCTTGGMLVLELVLSRLENRRTVALAAITVAAGCSWSALLALIQRLPRNWMQEGSYLTTQFGLYMRVPRRSPPTGRRLTFCRRCAPRRYVSPSGIDSRGLERSAFRLDRNSRSVRLRATARFTWSASR